MATTKRLDLFVKPTSTATEQEVYDFGLNWVNDRTASPSNEDANGDPIEAYYTDVTDFNRGGKKYMIFSDLAKTMLGLEQKMDILDPMTYATKVSLDSAVETIDSNIDRITILENADDGIDAVVI